MKLKIITLMLIFSQIVFANEDVKQFTFGYKYDQITSKVEGKCSALKEADYKKIHECKKDSPTKECPQCGVDPDIRRCKLDKKTAINIFPTQDKCKVSLQMATEGD